MNALRHRGQKFVNVLTQLFRLHAFGNPGKPAYIGEHDRQLAIFADDRTKTRWIAGHLLDHLGRHVLAKQIGNRPPCPAFQAIAQGQVDTGQKRDQQQCGRQGHDRTEAGKRDPVPSDQPDQASRTQCQHAEHASRGHRDRQQCTGQCHRQQRRQPRIFGCLLYNRARRASLHRLQGTSDQGRVNFHAGRATADRRRAQIG